MTNKSSFSKLLHDYPWIWVCAGSIAMWLIMCVMSGKLSFQSLQANMIAASFLAIVAIGQMFVVTTGKGAMDLSIPGAITLGAFLNVTLIDGDLNRIGIGIIGVIIAGIIIGGINSICVLPLRIPPMIATLAVNYILGTAALLLNNRMGMPSLVQAPILVFIATGKTFGVYNMVIIVVALTAITAFLLHKTTYGKSLIALGQNERSAHFAGVKTNRVQIITYMFSSVMACLAGFFLAVRSGGAFFGMGDDYLMDTVAAVVLGGTLMSGGKSTVVGTLFGALFIRILVTLMQLAQFPIGVQNIVKGIIIVLIIIVGTPSRKKTEQM